MCITLLLMTTLIGSAQGIPYIWNISSTEYKAHNQNFDIITGKDGTVYIANFEGLLYYDYSSWHIIHTPGVTRITAVFCDSKGTIWTGGYNYIGHTEHDKNGRLALHHIDTQNVFKGEVEWIWETDGNIFFRGSGNIIYTVREDKVELAPNAKLPTGGFSILIEKAHITQVQALENGLKAISTNGSGLILVDENDKEFLRITEDNGLCSNNINHITYNRNGIIWGATDNGVFAIGFPSIYSHFTKHEGLKGEVLAIEKMNGKLYVGTLNGLFYLQDKRFIPVNEVHHACWQLIQQNSSLLAATSDGTYLITPENKVQHLTTNNTLSLLDDNDGFYSGEMDGVFFNTPNGRKKVSDVEKVVKILKDSLGTIWMQNLYGKIWKSFEPYNEKGNDAVTTLVNVMGKITPISSSDVKPFPYPAYSYLDAKNNILWLTNNKNRFTYAYRNGGKDQKMSAFVYPLMDYSSRAMLRDGSLLWMGGDKGINVVDFSHVEPTHDSEPEIIIRTVLVGNDSVIWGGYGNMPSENFVLDSDVRDLTIQYSTVTPSLLLKTQYRHRLNSSDWTAWQTETQEEFPKLGYGDYTFEVQARDAFGRFSNIAKFKFSIKTPFYLRWYMILFYILLFMLMVYYMMMWRLKRLENEKIRLENVVQERTAEVVKQKDEIEEKSKNLETALHELSETQHQLVRQEKMATVGKLTQGLIDRILNPLNYINNFAKLSVGLVKDVKDNVDDEKEHMDPENYEDTIDVLGMLKGNLEKVGEHGMNTTRILKAMEELLKDHSGNMVDIDLTGLLKQNKEMLDKYFEKEIAEYNIKTLLECPNEDIHVKANAEQLSKVFLSMLSNSIYAVIKKTQRQGYTNGEQPCVKLSAAEISQHVNICIHDNGIGIEDSIIDKIFDPFFTTKTTAEASGIGLYVSKEIAQNTGGDISAHSQKNVYTEFTITLPTL